jgi:hypothetical protein
MAAGIVGRSARIGTSAQSLRGSRDRHTTPILRRSPCGGRGGLRTPIMRSRTAYRPLDALGRAAAEVTELPARSGVALGTR